METKDELKPCPFCGGEAEIKKGCTFGGNFYFVKCKKCSSEGERKYGKSEAIAAWNKRVCCEKKPERLAANSDAVNGLGANSEKPNTLGEIETMRRKLEYYEGDAGGASVADLLAENKALWRYVHFCRNASANDFQEIRDKAIGLLVEQKSGLFLTPKLTYTDVEKMVRPLEWKGNIAENLLGAFMIVEDKDSDGGLSLVFDDYWLCFGGSIAELKQAAQRFLVDLVAAALGVERSAE